MLTMNSDERREIVARGIGYYCKAVLYHNGEIDGDTIYDGYAATLKDAKRWCDIADGKLQDVAEQNPDTFMTATYILQLRTDTWETYTLTRYYG